MTRKTIHMLAAIVVGLALLLFVLRSVEQHGTAVSGGRLLPDFQAVANDATEVSITTPDGPDPVTVRRAGEQWVVPGRSDYPADLGALRQLIISLASAEIIEEKTSDPGQYGKLGVGDPAKGGQGTRIDITGPEFAYSVILGNAAQRDSQYARIAGKAASYLIDQDPELPADVGAWLVPDIVDIDSARVQRVVIAHDDGETITIGKSGQEQTGFEVADVPEGRELSYATVGNGIAGVLDLLELEDVRARVQAPPTTSVVVDTWEGLTISAEVVSDDEATWVAFAAESAGDDAEVASKAAAINARVAGWQYQLTSQKANLLTRRWEDILKDDGE